jgi:hypothetical protein
LCSFGGMIPQGGCFFLQGIYFKTLFAFLLLAVGMWVRNVCPNCRSKRMSNCALMYPIRFNIRNIFLFKKIKKICDYVKFIEIKNCEIQLQLIWKQDFKILFSILTFSLFIETTEFDLSKLRLTRMQQQTDGNKSEERFGFLRFALSVCLFVCLSVWLHSKKEWPSFRLMNCIEQITFFANFTWWSSKKKKILTFDWFIFRKHIYNNQNHYSTHYKL